MSPWSAAEWAGTILALVGAWMVSGRNPLGFFLFIVSDALLSVLAVHLHTYGLLSLYVAFAAINIRGLVWKKS